MCICHRSTPLLLAFPFWVSLNPDISSHQPCPPVLRAWLSHRPTQIIKANEWSGIATNASAKNLWTKSLTLRPLFPLWYGVSSSQGFKGPFRAIQRLTRRRFVQLVFRSSGWTEVHGHFSQSSVQDCFHWKYCPWTDLLWVASNLG